MSQINVNTITNRDETGGPVIVGVTTISGLTYPTAGALSNRNLIINGAMQVAQRGTSFTGLTSATNYGADRHGFVISGAGTWTVENSTTSLDAFKDSVKIDCTTAKASLGANDQCNFRYNFEGQDLQHLKKGTSAAESLTLSFWVQSNKTGTYIVELFDSDNTRHISRSYTIDSSSTWEQKTITFPGDTTGSLDNDNDNSLTVRWWLAAGTDWTSGTLATSWQAQDNTDRAVGQVNLADSTNNEWQITGVQLEVGTVATPFEHRSFGDELARCQRYYQQSWTGDAATGPTTDGDIVACPLSNSTGLLIGTTFLLQTMRATPTLTEVGSATLNSGWCIVTGSGTPVAKPGILQAKGDRRTIKLSVPVSGVTSGESYATIGNWTASAEL
jgi:hypothetical protein